MLDEYIFNLYSQIGSPSILLNAGKTTNFQFQLVGKRLSCEEIEEINNISGRSEIKERVSAVIQASCMFDFIKISNSIFSNNLVLIDSSLPRILACMVLRFYGSDLSKTSDLLADIEKENLLNFDTADNPPFYSYKIKRLYTDIALGMMPAKVWDGNYDATGGYLIVKNDGDVVCYYMHEKSQFENYLINNTKFEKASSSRHDFGRIYTEDKKLYMNLNLQIRFIK